MDRERFSLLIRQFHSARRDPERAVLEGFHPLKHALRFGAPIEAAVSPDPEALLELARALAPDVLEPLRALVRPVPEPVFRQLAPVPPDTGVLAVARRRPASASLLLASPRQAPLVLLERPSHLGNVGAAIRAAAAAGASGVVTTGPQDPWHPAAIRGAAGLQYALPVAQAEALPDTWHGPLLGIDPGGEPLTPGGIPSGAILAFGSERWGLSPELRARAQKLLAIPMRPGVSSLNLATAVAVVLYTWRLWPGSPPAEEPAAGPAL